ncbi:MULTISPECIES: SGNH/GDSL hydrolase family protein [unclassified Streptomyces]|uniref:SGNH/GDSL hydrolase family protein n=1 Tax=unclassified Streptomyces TaxID=2593676 RepID=UPI0035DFA192
MTRYQFGGTAADVAEDVAGARVPGAAGSVWDGTSEGASQVTDLTDLEGGPLSELVADADGMIPAFYGPEGAVRLWMDFGGPRVALVANDAGEHLVDHLGASDPHGTLATMMGELADQKGSPGGLATLEANGRLTPAQLPFCFPGGYIPSDWGKNWRAKRDAAATGKARLVVVGGSFSQGYYASDMNNTSWVGLVRQSLQNQYGDGGSGALTASRTGVYYSHAVATPLWETNGSFATTTGSWNTGSNNYGPGGSYIVTERVGASATFKVRGSTVHIYYVVGNASATSRASFTYTIDGGAPTTVTPPVTGPWGISKATSTGLTDDLHTVKITWAGTADNTNQFVSICSVNGENSTGVIVDNFAKYGAASSYYAGIAASDLNADWNGGISYPGDLVIYAAAPNDVSAGVTAADWAKNVAKYFSSVRAVDSGKTDLVLLLPHIGKRDASVFVYHDYVAKARGLAEAYGAAFVNLWALGRSSWDYWSSLGYWGTASNPGAAGSDPIHPSDAGHAYVANAILPLLKS